MLKKFEIKASYTGFYSNQQINVAKINGFYHWQKVRLNKFGKISKGHLQEYLN